MSPGRISASNSASGRGGFVQCSITRPPMASAARTARLSGSSPASPTTSSWLRTLMPRIRSAWSRAAPTAASTSAYGRWLSSPTFKYVSPMAEMLRKANIRTRERDSTHSRMPSKLPAPVLPPSTHVVTPVERATSSVRGPKSAAPAKQCACKSMSPGRTSRPVTSSTVSPSGASPARTSVTRPSRTRTSSAPASPAPGSTTCPPRSSTPITRLRPWPGKDPVRSGGVSLPEGVLLSEGSPLLAALSALARDARCAFFAGLPGTGKSLLIHQLAHLPHARGRRIRLLQWDVARPAFEASAAGRRYPQEAGVTHGLIRVAVGRWTRPALARWHAEHPASDVLIGETPFVGHRLIELARSIDDAAEPLLASPATRFVIPVPSASLRRHLESERARRASARTHRPTSCAACGASSSAWRAPSAWPASPTIPRTIRRPTDRSTSGCSRIDTHRRWSSTSGCPRGACPPTIFGFRPPTWCRAKMTSRASSRKPRSATPTRRRSAARSKAGSLSDSLSPEDGHDDDRPAVSDGRADRELPAGRLPRRAASHRRRARRGAAAADRRVRRALARRQPERRRLRSRPAPHRGGAGPQAHQEPGRPRSALRVGGAGVAHPRRRRRADRAVAPLSPQQAEPQGQPRRRAGRGAPGRRVLPALQRRRAGGGAAAGRRDGRERRDGGAAGQPPRPDPYPLRRARALRGLHARGGHRAPGSKPRGAARAARRERAHPSLPARALVGAQHLVRRPAPAHQRLRGGRRGAAGGGPDGLAALRTARAGHRPGRRAAHRGRDADAAGLQQRLHVDLRAAGREREDVGLSP